MSPHGPSGVFDFLVVSNRLPVSFRLQKNGSRKAVLSPGGLVSALGPALQEKEVAWVGWDGTDSGSDDSIIMNKIKIFPVPLGPELVAGHYEGFSNGTLWPLFHDVGVEPVYNSKWWGAYREVNKIFAERVGALAAPEAIIWVHDYQMMMVPKLLRDKRPDLTIGYFHHIPFCRPENLSKLAEGPSILDGLVAADISGFQRETDRINYMECLDQYSKSYGQHRAKTYPIQIDFWSVSNKARNSGVQKRAAEIRRELGNPKKIFLGVDRLDYTKGIIQRLESFERILTSGNVSVNDVVMLQTASPSRQNVPAYQNLRLQIEQLAGRVNRVFRAENDRPAIVLSVENFNYSEILARYVASDVMVVSSLRDGMNLVAKEFVACKNDELGILLLSPFTGAADEIIGAVEADPTKPKEFDSAMRVAVSMSSSEQKKRMDSMRAGLSRQSSSSWVNLILKDLSACR